MEARFPVTILGPRTSSNGVGWTLGLSVQCARACPDTGPSQLTGSIAVSTLSLGMFPEQPPLVSGPLGMTILTRQHVRSGTDCRVVLDISRFILYACILAWIIYLVPVSPTLSCLGMHAHDKNEPLTNVYARDPFWNAPNRVAFMRLHKDAYFQEPADYWSKTK